MELSGELSSLEMRIVRRDNFPLQSYNTRYHYNKTVEGYTDCFKMIKTIVITSTITTTATTFIQQPFPQDLNDMFSD